MLKDRWLRVGLAGALVTGLCCFAPLLIWALAALGLSAWVGWVDLVILPLFCIFVIIVVARLIRIRIVGA